MNGAEAVIDTDQGAKTVSAGKEPSKIMTSNSVIVVDGIEYTAVSCGNKNH